MTRKAILSIDNLNIGGAQEQVRKFSAYLKDNNFEVEFIICYPESYSRNTTILKHILRAYYNLKFTLRILLSLMESKEEVKYFSFLSKSNFIFFICTQIFCCKEDIYFAYRNDRKLWNIKDFIVLHFAQRRNLKISTNNLVYFRFFRLHGYKVYYMPNLLKQNFKISGMTEGGLNNFISVCRCVPSKRILEILDFVFYVANRSENKIYFSLFLRSDDLVYESAVLEKIKSLESQSNNLIISTFMNKKADYSRGSFLLHFSDVESSPNVVLEAIAERVYPIIFDISAYTVIRKHLFEELVLRRFSSDNYREIYSNLERITSFNFDALILRLKSEEDFYYKVLLNG